MPCQPPPCQHRAVRGAVQTGSCFASHISTSLSSARRPHPVHRPSSALPRAPPPGLPGDPRPLGGDVPRPSSGPVTFPHQPFCPLALCLCLSLCLPCLSQTFDLLRSQRHNVKGYFERRTTGSRPCGARSGRAPCLCSHGPRPVSATLMSCSSRRRPPFLPVTVQPSAPRALGERLEVLEAPARLLTCRASRPSSCPWLAVPPSSTSLGSGPAATLPPAPPPSLLGCLRLPPGVFHLPGSKPGSTRHPFPSASGVPGLEPAQRVPHSAPVPSGGTLLGGWGCNFQERRPPLAVGRAQPSTQRAKYPGGGPG